MRLCFKVVVVGESGVGKTTLVKLLQNPSFQWSAVQATIQPVDVVGLDMNVKNENITLMVWDTAGQERFRSTVSTYHLRETDVALLVYDTTRPETVDALDWWHTELTSTLGDIPMVVVGTKTDATQSSLQLPELPWARHTFFTTARDPTSVKEVFSAAAALAMEATKFNSPRSSTRDEDGSCSPSSFALKEKKEKKRDCPCLIM
eukprot:TRINITY_DN61492_c0_g1_i1.p1 TRINITY_DN61492_c0_g1~~TRINITY_DN61492_c0_g1_i1.p1  ORF type:complete len:204 (-),score=22.71 TRINITY_DN61492_c0_g1_i1:66-677(-)